MERLDPLGVLLDRVVARYHRADQLGSDPLEFVHRYRDPWDQEAAALFSAVLAYGNVKQIRRAVAAALESLTERGGGSLAAGVRAKATPRARPLLPSRHRFTTAADLEILRRLLAETWRRHGSLGARFLALAEAADGDPAMALDALIKHWEERARAWGAAPSFYYLLTPPRRGSACKRWMMLLRWMGRRDGVDPGLWTDAGPPVLREAGGVAGRRLPGLDAARLFMPLDTHTSRIARYLGLTRRRSADWKAVLEVTAALRALAPADPARYDFALARLGILDHCQHRYVEKICRDCALVSACSFARPHNAQQGSPAGPGSVDRRRL